MNDDQLIALFSEFMESDSPDAEFRIERPIEAQARDGLDRTFSMESLDTLSTQMITWVGTRMMKYEEATGLSPQNVSVVISVRANA